ncbi:hypothetical protein C2E25_15210 [Geothermobacter hydrogeniphilus]|uniref:Tetratricopeptide repeat protein n=1 Tax=Geothermobacter hydrogeniphilus TaxID=1969733 RepID=A0A2K2H6M8_9BACT|nr:tetratricopeptide repeat protein [Geothermobacter hydrogeniphilus]PNU18909.1 hypothetical protein C2E25_15210 [Geothermobacter hydrogeniphilus]
MTEKSVSLLGKIAGFTEILAKDPQSTVFVSLSEAYRQLGMLDDALEIAQKGTQHLPGFSPGYIVLGRILAQQGDLAKAALAFEQALAIEETSLQALKGLARTRYRQGYLDRARELLHKAEILNPHDPIVQKMLASIGRTAVESSGREQGSAAATTVDPPERRIESLSEGTATDAGMRSEPAEPPGSGFTDEVKAASPAEEISAQATPLQTTTLAQLYFKQGLYDEAAAIYRDILRQDPHNEEIRARLVQIKELQASVKVADSPAPVEQGQVEQAQVEQAQVEQAQVVSHRKQLEIYQRWLNAIAQRRAHVC